MQTDDGSKPHVLTCWKEIASYMGKGVRTVQRWEQEFGLPIRRPLGSNKKAVLARPSDLDAWVSLRCSVRTPLSTADNTHNDSVLRLAALSAHIETTSRLRDRNGVLLGELQSALERMRRQILSLQSSIEAASTDVGKLAGPGQPAFRSSGQGARSHVSISGTASHLHPYSEAATRPEYNS